MVEEDLKMVNVIIIFFYDHEDNLIRKTIVDTCQSQGIIFFDNDELIDQAIKEAGKDNIKKYIFGVYDEWYG